MAQAEKRRLRTKVKRLIGSMPDADRMAKSEAACRRLADVPELKQADTVAVYATLADEVDVWPLIHRLVRAGKRVLFPRCLPRVRQMLCVEVKNFEELVPGTFHIPEPPSNQAVAPCDVDVVVTPGRAFDTDGNRLGRGAGYYDRFFLTPGFKAFKIGVAFDCQIFSAVPFDDKDVPVDALVTESRFIRNHGPDVKRGR